jgi:hypothetical protein
MPRRRRRILTAVAAEPGRDHRLHSHPGPSLILVVAGSVTNYPGGGDVHMLRNETNATAETIAVQLLPRTPPEGSTPGSGQLPRLGSGRSPDRPGTWPHPPGTAPGADSPRTIEKSGAGGCHDTAHRPQRTDRHRDRPTSSRSG